MIINTKRLVIRELSQKDAGFILNLYNQPSFIENIGDRGLKTIIDVKKWLDSVNEHYHNFGYWLYAVCLKESGDCIGVNGLVQRDYFHEPDIGFAFLPEHCRQGYAFESSQAILSHAKALRHSSLSHAEQILAITSPSNTASQQLLLKLGFTQQTNIKIESNTEGKTESVNKFSFTL